MEAFSPEHMQLLARAQEELPARSPALDRWFVVVFPALRAWTKQSRYLSGQPVDQKDEALADCVGLLHRRIARGKFNREIERPKAFFRTSWKRLILDWLDRRNRTRARERHLTDEHGTNRIDELDRALSGEAGEPDSDELVATCERSTLASAVLGSWRTWPVPTVPRFVCAVEAIPDDIARSDVSDATEASKTSVRTGKDGKKQTRRDGLTRGCDESWALLEPWTAEWSHHRDRGAITPPPGLTRQLAFALRGPPETLRPENWSEAEEKTALDWLYQQRARTKKRLEQRLGPLLTEGGGA